MEMILRKNGFTKDIDENEWTRNDWTVRIDGNTMEVFNDPDKTVGKYYIGPISKIDFEELLKDIDYIDSLN
jgi:hypothetical protein